MDFFEKSVGKKLLVLHVPQRNFFDFSEKPSCWVEIGCVATVRGNFFDFSKNQVVGNQQSLLKYFTGTLLTFQEFKLVGINC